LLTPVDEGLTCVSTESAVRFSVFPPFLFVLLHAFVSLVPGVCPGSALSFPTFPPWCSRCVLCPSNRNILEQARLSRAPRFSLCFTCSLPLSSRLLFLSSSPFLLIFFFFQHPALEFAPTGFKPIFFSFSPLPQMFSLENFPVPS